MEKKEDDIGVVKMDKMQVLQEARIFNSTPSPRRCRYGRKEQQRVKEIG
jgi:hypothetical protein